MTTSKVFTNTCNDVAQRSY